MDVITTVLIAIGVVFVYANIILYVLFRVGVIGHGPDQPGAWNE